MGLIASVNSGIELVEKAGKLADELKNLDLKEVIVELKSKLVDLKAECVELREENAKLTAEINRLSEPPKVEVKDGVYYFVENGDGPFCTGCYDTKKVPIRLTEMSQRERAVTRNKWRCPSCKNLYK